MTAFVVELCRGCSRECRFSLADLRTFRERVEETIVTSGWPEFLQQRLGSQPKRHQQFSVAVAACPNGCSRPHIADIGFIRGEWPSLPGTHAGASTENPKDAGAGFELCSGCGACARVCPESALSMNDRLPVLNPASCLACGQCRRICPTGAIGVGDEGFRIVLGGRLGRHPRLATELPGRFSETISLAILARCLDVYMNAFQPDLRFATLVEARDARLEAALAEWL